MGAYVDVDGLNMYYEVAGSRTADVEGPYSYQVFAQDVAGFIEDLDLGPVRLGWSNGASVALRLALQRPDLVHRVVLLSGGTTGPDGETADHGAVGGPPRG